MPNRNIITIILLMVFGIGAGVIVYNGRPVMKLDQTAASQPAAMVPAVNQNITPVQNTDLFPATASPAPTNPIQTPAPIQASAQAATHAPAPPPTPVNAPGTYTMSQVAQHNTPGDCWTVINGVIYSMSDFVNRHPGGPDRIIAICGIDATTAFENQHSGSRAANAALMSLLKIGKVI